MAQNARRGGPEPEEQAQPPSGNDHETPIVSGRRVRQRRRRPRGWPRGIGSEGVARGREPLEHAHHESTRSARHASLKEASRVLLTEVRARIQSERAVVLVRFAGHQEFVAAGVTDEEAAGLVAILGDGRPRGLREWPSVPTPFPDIPLPPPSSFASPILVPGAHGPDFAAAVVIDAPSSDPALERVLTCVRRAAPELARLADLEALRTRIHTVEADQLRLSRVLDMLPDPVMVTDARNQVLLTNTRAEQLLTAGPGDSPGRHHAVETNNLFFSAFRARAVLQEDAQDEHRELLLIDPNDGSDLLFEVFFHPFSAEGGRTDSTIYVLHDITDLRRVTVELEAQFNRAVATEHAARRESERLNVIIENAGVPILVTDRQTRIVLMNREAERLFELTRETGEDDVMAVYPNDARLMAMIHDFMLQPQLLRQEYLELLDPQGGGFPVEALSTKIVDRNGEPTAVVTVLHDQTQEVENERLAEELRVFNQELAERVAGATKELAERNRQLEAQRSELERASRLKSEFLATMSHELRTPINAALGYNALLREGLFGPLTERQKDALERIRMSAERLLSIINDILDLTKVEAGRVVLLPSDIDPARFLERLSRDVRPMVERKSLEYRVEIEEDLPLLRVDEMRLRQVLLNLLSNAVKFTESGSVTLRARGAREHILFEVADTGIGIAAHQMDAIFEEFRQVDQSITREHGGTGLGLAISRKLLDLMTGTLEVESEQGRGALFRVRLPLLPGARPER